VRLLETPTPVRLEATLRGGQSFRWRGPRDDGSFVGVARGRRWRLEPAPEGVRFEAWPSDGARSVLADYLDVGDAYATALRRLGGDPLLREAVHRYQFEKYNEDNEQQVDYYFLSSGWQKEPSGTRKQRKDPPGKFLERFADQSPKIKPASMADVKGRRPPLPNSPSPAVVHKKNGKSGLIFGVDSMRWVNNNTVEVQGNYCGKTFAAGSTYRVKRSNGEWIVAKAEPRWIT
jgi:hypothetical protein